MSKSTTNTVTLAGKTAVELRELLASKTVTKATVVAYLTEKETKTGLRAPAKKLLAELTEAKPAAPKPEARPVAPAPETNVLADLLAQVRVLTERIAALEGVKVEKPEPVAAKPAPKPEPVKAAPKPEPVKAKPAPAKPEAKPAAPVIEDDAMTEAEAREEFASLKLAQLRDIADFDTTGMSKSEIVEEMVARATLEDVLARALDALGVIVPCDLAAVYRLSGQAIEEGVVVAAPAKAQGKPDLKVLARDIAVEF